MSQPPFVAVVTGGRSIPGYSGRYWGPDENADPAESKPLREEDGWKSLGYTTDPQEIPGVTTTTLEQAAALADDGNPTPVCGGCNTVLTPRLGATSEHREQGQWFDHPPIPGGRPMADLIGHTANVLQPSRVWVTNPLMPQDPADTDQPVTYLVADDPHLTDVLNRPHLRLILMAVGAAEIVMAHISAGDIKPPGARVVLVADDTADERHLTMLMHGLRAKTTVAHDDYETIEAAIKVPESLTKLP